MLELISFIILFFLGVLVIMLEKHLLLKYVYLPALFLFMFIVRLNGFYLGGYQKDILTYAIEMHEVSYHFYYLREFIGWFSLKFIYMLVQSEFYTFIVLDFIWIYYLYKCFKFISVDKLGKGCVVVLATSFPFFFGYENIYRQFYASIILLYAYSLIHIKSFKAIRLFIISFFIHNVVLFLLPIFIVKKCFSFNLKDRIILALLVSVCFVFALPFITNLKDADPTKVDMSFLYLILFIGLFAYLIMKYKKNIYNVFYRAPSLFFFVILMIGYVFFQQEMIAERLGMMFVIFLIYDLYNYSLEIKNRLIRVGLRLTLLIVFSVPVLLFKSAMRFMF